jgi:hypothetical protein
MRTCMAIDEGNKRTLKGLVAYMVAANVRLLCAAPILPPPAAAAAQAQDGGGETGEGGAEGVWHEAVDEASGKGYYYNSVSNATSWKRPSSPIRARGAGKGAQGGEVQCFGV